MAAQPLKDRPAAVRWSFAGGAADWRGALLVFVSVLVVYGPGLGDRFHYDDFHSVVHNPHLRSTAHLGDFFVDPSLFSANSAGAMYRPLLLASYVANFAIDDRALFFRWGNLLLHAGNSVLVLWFLRRLGGRAALALGAALVFALNPLNSEAVHYISSRSELLMAGGVLAASCAYGRWRADGGWLWYAVALLAGAGALLSKAVGIVLPGLLFLAEIHASGVRGALKRLPGIAPFGLCGLLYLAFTSQLLGKALGEPVRSLDVQLWTQIKALAYYLYLAVTPARLSVEHPFSTSVAITLPVIMAAALAATVLVVLWRQGANGRWLSGWTALSLAPTAVVPLYVLVNEHRLYLAGVAWAWGICLVWAALPRRRMARWAGAAYTIVLALLVSERAAAWTDELSLWGDAREKAPRMLKPHLRVADELARLGRVREAEKAYRAALDLVPEHVAGRNNLARLYLRTGRAAEAVALWRELVRQHPDNVPALLNLAGVEGAAGRWDAVEALARRVLLTDKANGAAHGLLAAVFLEGRAQPGTALKHLDLALLEDPEDARLHLQRGVALRRLGQSAEAEAAYRRSLQLEPDAADAWFNLGNLLEEAGRIEAAATAFARATREPGALGQAARQRLERLGGVPPVQDE